VFHISDELDIATVVAIAIPLLLLLVVAVVDIVRRKDLTVVRKVLWIALIALTAYVGLAIYFIARPPRAPEGKRYGSTEPRSSTVVDQLEHLRSDRRTGALDDDTYLVRKREILGLDAGST
jgi:Phospholipase_D-nuclease N-terminal